MASSLPLWWLPARRCNRALCRRCSRQRRRLPKGTGTGRARRSLGRLAPDRTVLIALEGRAAAPIVTATGAWRIDEQGGRVALVRGSGTERWRIEQRGGLLRVAGDGSDATPWREGPFVARPANGESHLRFGNRRYRGELLFTATDSGVLVVNRLPVEDYLRGVVPIEIGTRQEGDLAAIEAQTIAARSYTYMRVPSDGAQQPARGWHMTGTVQYQVYAGMDVEHPVINEAVDATAGLVLRYGGLIVDAPYFFVVWWSHGWAARSLARRAR